MTDYFALLQQPRRPWLDIELVKQKYRELARTAHPDQQPAGASAIDFAQLNQAHRVLIDPKLRLEHLLQLEGVSSRSIDQIPNDLSDLFMAVGTALKSNDQLQIEEASRTLDQTLQAALTHLKLLDQEWERDRGAVVPGLSELARRLAFINRWLSLLKERQVQATL